MAPDPAPDDAAKSANAARIWEEAVPFRGTSAERYLMDGRMIDTTILTIDMLADVRFHPACPIGHGFLQEPKAPAMICRLRNALTGEPANAIQRTFLNEDGTKAPQFGRNGRASLGRYGDNGAVVFGTPSQGKDHFECEGVEDVLTLLSVRPSATGMAVLSVARLGKLDVPSGVLRTIGGDAKTERDRDAASDAAQSLANRIMRSIRLAFPPLGHGDFNAAMMAGELERIEAALDDAVPIKPVSMLLQFGDQPLDIDSGQYIVKGLLGRGELGSIYGPSTAGKTFVALELAWSVVLGAQFQGRRVDQAPVLYVNFEGARGFQLRMEAARRAHGPAPWFARLTAKVNLSRGASGDGVKTIIEASKKLSLAAGKDVCLIVIDTLSRAMAGDDENSNSDMMAFVNLCEEIIQETGAAILVVHHTGKNPEKGMRGSSSLFASCDFVASLVGTEKDTRQIRYEKVKDGEVGVAAKFELRKVHLGIDRDGDAITSCVVCFGDGPIERRKQPSRLHRDLLRNLDQIILEGRFEVTCEREGVPGGRKAVRHDDLVQRCVKAGLSAAKHPVDVVKKEIKKLRDCGWIAMFDNLVWRIDH